MDPNILTTLCSIFHILVMQYKLTCLTVHDKVMKMSKSKHVEKKEKAYYDGDVSQMIQSLVKRYCHEFHSIF